MKKQVRIVKDNTSSYDNFYVQFLEISYIFGLKKVEKWKDIIHHFGCAGTRYFTKLKDAEDFLNNWDGTEVYPTETVIKESTWYSAE